MMESLKSNVSYSPRNVKPWRGYRNLQNCCIADHQTLPSPQDTRSFKNESRHFAMGDGVDNGHDETPMNDFTAGYLVDLLKERNGMGMFPQAFFHLERLVENEISRVQMDLFQFSFSDDEQDLPDAKGEPITVKEKVYIPTKEHPDYNFVGRILGPRGMTAKQLEVETGCRIMVRGRGSMRDTDREERNRGKPNWEHLEDELHVLVQCDDAPNRAQLMLDRAVKQIRKLLIPAPFGKDDLKRKQLMELAIMNGTYRPGNRTHESLVGPMSRNMQAWHLHPLMEPHDFVPSHRFNYNVPNSCPMSFNVPPRNATNRRRDMRRFHRAVTPPPASAPSTADTESQKTTKTEDSDS